MNELAGTRPSPQVRALLLCVLAALLAISPARAKEQVNRLGPVAVTTTLSPDDLVIGDEVVLEIRVEAEADVEVLMPEFGEALDRYDIVDFVPQKTIGASGQQTHRQRYTLQPKASGPHSIPPILVEFVDQRPGQDPSPDDFDAYEILTDRLDFEVQSVIPAGASAELEAPLGELPPVSQVTPAGWMLRIVLGVSLLFGLALAGIAYRRWTVRQRRESAYEIAMRALSRELAKPRPETSTEVDAFFVVTSGIVRTYLENRFDLRAPDLTTEEFLDLAGTSRDLSPAHQVLLRDFLRQADLVKFAGLQASPAEIEQAGQLAKQFLNETRENSPSIEVQPTAAEEGPVRA